MPLKVHKDIASLVPYAPGKPMEELERELGIAGAVILDDDEEGHAVRGAAVRAPDTSNAGVVSPTLR